MATAPILNADHELMLRIYTTMVRISEADKAIQRGLSAGELQFQYYPAGGQEAIPAGIAPHLRREDYAVITYRCIHDVVAKGTPLKEIMAEMYGRAAGTSKGKGGPMHLSDPHAGLMVTTGIVGAGLPIANGLALATQMQGSGRVTVVNFGDGATSTGAFHEALTLASVWKLPVVFVCQNNQYAEYTALAEYTRSENFAKKADAYEIPGVRVDGNDPLAVYAAAGDAIARARRGDGPMFIEAVCHRLQGHAFGSDDRTWTRRRSTRRRGCPDRHSERACCGGRRQRERARAAREGHPRRKSTTRSLSRARRRRRTRGTLHGRVLEPERHPGTRHARRYLRSWHPVPEAGTRQLPFAAAITDALDIALARDRASCCSAGHRGSCRRRPETHGLSSKYGRSAFDPPIAETAIVGAAIGSDRRHAPGCRNHDQRLSRSVHGPGREPRGQASLHVRRPHHGADGHSYDDGGIRRQLWCAAFAVAGGLARTHAGTQDRLSVNRP